MKLPEKRKAERKAKQPNAEPAQTEALQSEPIPQVTEKKVEVQQ
jgi:hypothetical protein